MSKTPLNKKYLELKNVHVYHNKKTNTLQIVSKDPDIKGKPFQISLQNGSPSETTLRDLLTNKGIINQDLPESYFIPKYVSANSFNATTPVKGETVNLFNKWNYIPLGITYKSSKLYVNVEEANHTIVTGWAGTGKTVLLKSIAHHCLNHPNNWDIYIATPHPVEYSYFHRHEQMQVTFTNKGLHSMLTKVHNIMQNRILNIAKQENSTDKSFPPNNKSIMFIIDGLLEFLYLCRPQNPEENEMVTEINMILKNILTFGKTAGIHVVTTNPFTKLNDKEILSLFATRICMGKTDNETLESLFGPHTPYQTTHVLGRGIVTSTSLAAESVELAEDVVEFQVPFYDKNPGC